MSEKQAGPKNPKSKYRARKAVAVASIVAAGTAGYFVREGVEAIENAHHTTTLGTEIVTLFPGSTVSEVSAEGINMIATRNNVDKSLIPTDELIADSYKAADESKKMHNQKYDQIWDRFEVALYTNELGELSLSVKPVIEEATS